jgi:hypothetical protein
MGVNFIDKGLPLPPTEQIAKCVYRTIDKDDPKEMALFKVYIEELLPPVIGRRKEFGTNTSHYQTISEATGSTKGVKHVTPQLLQNVSPSAQYSRFDFGRGETHRTFFFGIESIATFVRLCFGGTVTRSTANSIGIKDMATGKLALVQYSYRRITPTTGKMAVPGPKLRRSWPYYFDPDTNTLWSRTGEGFSVHSGIQISSNSRNTQFHLQTRRIDNQQYWRSWPYYFDPDTNTLWSRTGEGFSVHSGIQISSNSRNTQFHLQTNRQSTILPSHQSLSLLNAARQRRDSL